MSHNVVTIKNTLKTTGGAAYAIGGATPHELMCAQLLYNRCTAAVQPLYKLFNGCTTIRVGIRLTGRKRGFFEMARDVHQLKAW